MFVRGTVFILATLAILFVISPILAGSTCLGIIPILVFATIYGSKIREYQKNIQEEKALMSNVADESFGNIRTVKAFSNELEETNKFQRHNLKVFDISKARAVWYSFFLFFV